VVLRPFWSHQNGDGRAYPLERVDLLDRTKLFGDLHRISNWQLDRRVIPTIDVTAPAEAQPGFYGALTIGAGGAGTTGAVQLANLSSVPFRTIIVRPLSILVKPGAASDITIGLRTHQFLTGAPTTIPNNGLADSRRGIQAAVGGGLSQAQLQATANAANVLGDPQYRFDAGAGVYTPVPLPLLQAMIAGPQVDIVVVCQLANTALQVSWCWIEETFPAVTRQPNG
jgi:hypothetical protein